MMRTRLVRAMGISLVTGSMAFAMSAHAATQGLYSADDLLDSDVHDSTGEEIGEVEDILMDDGMSVHSLVIETGEVLGLGGTEIVAERGTFRVLRENDDDDFDDREYEVHLEATQEEIKELPEYDESWWNETSEALAQAWENTKEVSESAWENTKQATSSAWYNITN
ncbi:PRC-barrel domain-containing protein [Marinobacter zhanjiangensis]|nr:PRC-barrel domain-containing protein [Marinobacter zhanjiangensis]